MYAQAKCNPQFGPAFIFQSQKISEATGIVKQASVLSTWRTLHTVLLWVQLALGDGQVKDLKLIIFKTKETITGISDCE